MSDSVRRARRNVGKGKHSFVPTTISDYRQQQSVASLKASFQEEKDGYVAKINKLKGELRATQNMVQSASAEAKAAMASRAANDTKEIKSLLEAKTATLEARVQELTQLLQDVEKKASRDDTSRSQQRMHIGASCNLPEQPTPVQEGGAYKTPPLALSVNGAVAVHNIGYTSDRKNLAPVHYDASSERLVVYVPNK